MPSVNRFRAMPVLAASAGLTALLAPAGAANAANVQATYFFGNTLAAEEPGVTALTAIDPLGTAVFEDATVFGNTRRVYHWSGAEFPLSDQGGLELSTTGLVAGNDYSAELVFRFFDRQNGWRRILDVEHRSSDNGFYVDPSNRLDVYPVIGTGPDFTNDEFHHVVLTVAPDGTTAAFLDGVLSFTTNTPVMNITADNLIALFVDNNLGGSFQNEWSSGQIALFRLYSGQLTADEVRTLASDPFVPTPGAAAVLVGGVVLAGRRRR